MRLGGIKIRASIFSLLTFALAGLAVQGRQVSRAFVSERIAFTLAFVNAKVGSCTRAMWLDAFASTGFRVEVWSRTSALISVFLAGASTGLSIKSEVVFAHAAFICFADTCAGCGIKVRRVACTAGFHRVIALALACFEVELW